MKFISTFFLIFLLFNGCQTIENKSKETIKKENEKMSKFLQQPESELKIAMGEPDEITYDAKGSKFFIYKKKKYTITCEKKFEIDQNKMIIAVSSRGCFYSTCGDDNLRKQGSKLFYWNKFLFLLFWYDFFTTNCQKTILKFCITYFYIICNSK